MDSPLPSDLIAEPLDYGSYLAKLRPSAVQPLDRLSQFVGRYLAV